MEGSMKIEVPKPLIVSPTLPTQAAPKDLMLVGSIFVPTTTLITEISDKDLKRYGKGKK
jgi:hypothetical protein